MKREKGPEGGAAAAAATAGAAARRPPRTGGGRPRAGGRRRNGLGMRRPTMAVIWDGHHLNVPCIGRQATGRGVCHPLEKPWIGARAQRLGLRAPCRECRVHQAHGHHLVLLLPTTGEVVLHRIGVDPAHPVPRLPRLPDPLPRDPLSKVLRPQ